MKQKLKNFCSSIDIEYVGIAPVGPYTELAYRWQKRVQNEHITGFEEKDFSKRIDPTLTLSCAKSVIVCLFPYYCAKNNNINLSKSSISEDYHIIVKNKLIQIGEFLQSLIPDFEYKAFTDNGPLADRYMAYLAGLGFYGVNSHIINEKYGSYVFIGYIINNYPFRPDQTLEKTCMQCGKCMQACPGNAIIGNFDINPLNCCSYITQKKGELSQKEIESLNKSTFAFGCDICQDVCPHNIDVPDTPIAEFRENIIQSISPSELKEMSNKEFARIYKNRAFGWRGKAVLIRNFEHINKK